LATEEGTARYLQEFVHSYSNLDEYLALIGHDTLEQLNQGPTSFLLDPYRQWIQPRSANEALLADNAPTRSAT
jgi:glutaconate CoA-transferase subunit A